MQDKNAAALETVLRDLYSKGGAVREVLVPAVLNQASAQGVPAQAIADAVYNASNGQRPGIVVSHGHGGSTNVYGRPHVTPPTQPVSSPVPPPMPLTGGVVNSAGQQHHQNRHTGGYTPASSGPLDQSVRGNPPAPGLMGPQPLTDGFGGPRRGPAGELLFKQPPGPPPGPPSPASAYMIRPPGQ